MKAEPQDAITWRNLSAECSLTVVSLGPSLAPSEFVDFLTLSFLPIYWFLPTRGSDHKCALRWKKYSLGHVGDLCNTDPWASTPACQSMIEKEGRVAGLTSRFFWEVTLQAIGPPSFLFWQTLSQVASNKLLFLTEIARKLFDMKPGLAEACPSDIGPVPLGLLKNSVGK